MNHYTRRVTGRNTNTRLFVCIAAALTAGFALTQPLAAAEIVVNGGFEVPVVPYEKGWTTYYGQNATPTTCEEMGESECNDGTLIPGWSVVWFNDETGEIEGPGRIELQRDLPDKIIAGISAFEGAQKAELDSHHRFQPEGEPPVSNNIAIFQTLPTCSLTAYELSFAWKARTDIPGDSTVLVAVDDVIIESVGQFQPGWQEEHFKFISSPDPGQLIAFTSAGTANTKGALIDAVSVVGPDGIEPLDCERQAVCGKRPAVLEMLYDADSNNQDFYSQDEDSVRIIDHSDGPLPDVAKIVVRDHKRRSTILFEGTVAIGNTFEVTGANVYKRWVPPKLNFEIYDAESGSLVQEVEFHTSCSQPLFVGDQFGGVAVFNFSR